MPRRTPKKGIAVSFERVPDSGSWWIRYKVAGVEHREKVGRRSDAIKLYAIRKTDILRGMKLPANVKDADDTKPSEIDGGLGKHAWRPATKNRYKNVFGKTARLLLPMGLIDRRKRNGKKETHRIRWPIIVWDYRYN